jgi:transcriptional regulator GlxA family with amidase domain
MSVSEVALEVGFASFSHFAKVFAAATGGAPSEFRRSGGAGRQPRTGRSRGK